MKTKRLYDGIVPNEAGKEFSGLFYHATKSLIKEWMSMGFHPLDIERLATKQIEWQIAVALQCDT